MAMRVFDVKWPTYIIGMVMRVFIVWDFYRNLHGKNSHSHTNQFMLLWERCLFALVL